MLETMGWHPFLTLAMSHERTLGNIIVYAIYIRISMMDDIMFELPDKGIPPQGIERKSHQPVDPFPTGVAAMTSIMHDIEPNTSKYEPKQSAKQDAR